MRDTSAEADRVVRDAVRRMNPIERMRQALALSESLRQLSLARLRAKYPERSTVELVELLLGQPLPRPPRSSTEP
jgi:hypothetical protein